MPVADAPLKIGRYDIVNVLGKGAMGFVYEGYDPNIDRPVAIKTIRVDHLSPEDADEFEARFRAEVRAGGRLQHPNIVGVYDAGRDAGVAYIVMELVRGDDLKKMIDRGERFTVERALAITGELLGALHFAHEQGIVHRDVKPGNLMVKANGRVMLTDFGVARIVDSGESTMLGTVIGTLKYMAPEQLRGEPVDARTDVFAAGVLLYQLLTAQRPFDGDNDFATMQNILSAEPASPSMLVAGLPPEIDAVVAKALAKRREDRFASAFEFELALRDVVNRMASSAPGPTDATVIVRPSPLQTPPPLPPAPEPPVTADQTRIIRPAAGPPAPPPAAGAGAGAGEPGPAMQLVITASDDARHLGRVFALPDAGIEIGRDGGGLSLPDPGWSRRHARLDRHAAGYTLTDLGSVNGSFVDGRRAAPGTAVPLLLGAAIRIGGVVFSFNRADATGLPDLTGCEVAGRYVLERCLRESAKGAVYEARIKSFGGQVALKLLAPDVAAYPGYREQFEREAQVATHLRHRHICSVQDFGHAVIEAAGRRIETPYLCYALMSGGNLADRMQADAEPPGHDVATGWVSELAEALDHAHGRGVVHGGLKPTAVCFDADGHAHVTDFALAAFGGDQRALLGAPAFMAPEQWDGAAPGAKTDQFALAALAYVLLTGARPFDGQDDPKRRERNFRSGPPAAHEEARRNARGVLPKAASQALQRALAVDPEARFANVGEFAAALRGTLGRGAGGGSAQVFLSYQRESSSLAAILVARELQDRHGFTVFVDTQHQDGAVKFPQKLEHAIRHCEVFVCLLGASTLASRWVREEIRIAHQHDRPMIPVFQEAFAPPETVEISPEFEALFAYDGIKLYDRQGIYISHTIDNLATQVKLTLTTARRS